MSGLSAPQVISTIVFYAVVSGVFAWGLLSVLGVVITLVSFLASWAIAFIIIALIFSALIFGF